MLCFSCGKEPVVTSPTDVAPAGEILNLRGHLLSGRSFPVGEYGLYGAAHNYGDAFMWNDFATHPSPFYLHNVNATLTDGKLVFSDIYRYPITDYLSLLLYYPYHAAATPTSIPVGLKLDEPSPGVTLSYKYPDYMIGSKNDISVVGGTHEDQSEVSLTLRHLMARVHFRIKNPGVEAITLTYVRLNNITWEGTINPQITTSHGFFHPTGSPKNLMLIKSDGVVIDGTPSGSPVVPQYIPIDPKYNYSDEEAEAASLVYYDPASEYDYYLLVPPLEEVDLNEITLEIMVIQGSSTTTHTIEMKQPGILTWEPGKSYCYTITFNSFPITEVFGTIEPWQDDLFTGNVDL